MPSKRKRPKRDALPFEPLQLATPTKPAPLRLPMSNRDWLLADPKVEPVIYTPGTLIVHSVPMSQLAGTQLAFWQLIRYDIDPTEHRVLALCRAAPVSCFPGMVQWLPAGETFELRLGNEAAYPLASLAEQIRYAPRARPLLEQAAQREANGPDTYTDWLAKNWDQLDQAAEQNKAGRDDDPTLRAFIEAGISWQVPDLDTWNQRMVAMLELLGAKPIAIRRLLTEMGLQGGQIATLLS